MNRFHSIIKKGGKRKIIFKKYYQKAAKPILCPLSWRLHIFHMHPVGSSDPLVGCPIYGVKLNAKDVKNKVCKTVFGTQINMHIHAHK